MTNPCMNWSLSLFRNIPKHLTGQTCLFLHFVVYIVICYAKLRLKSQQKYVFLMQKLLHIAENFYFFPLLSILIHNSLFLQTKKRAFARLFQFSDSLYGHHVMFVCDRKCLQCLHPDQPAVVSGSSDYYRTGRQSDTINK